MSGDNSNSEMPRQSRGSVSSTPFTSLFQRRNSTSVRGTPAYPGPITSATLNDPQRRRLSITTLGLTGTSPTNPAQFGMRRGSISTNNSDVIEENAVVDDDDPTSARTAPTTPFTRRMSFGAQAMRNLRAPGGSSPSSNGRPSPPLRRGSVLGGPPTPPNSMSSSNGYTWNKTYSQASTKTNSRAASDLTPPAARSDQGFNWSEQLRSRAESTVASGPRPSISFAPGVSTSPPRGNGGAGPAAVPHHERAKSVSDMPAPPAQSPRPRQPQKPDHFQERILKGDFYMD
ncbi:hypothetical protein QBC33DRAFT_377145 [Phialemonium atrogriseum]|uniref:Uncharacterized protein n=1 Tax=Phialemonium atrogriseum TaxID=1093897 RepID=A0AAJ0C1J6_9PEZI|nr:uncharacterized protein QBC33DRAFT_377145 [Phialemonium atrogriseum]KAK1768429.1 hypothetical protein QBC33DRAFT_377145 [Phialemonium atrogriseum]